MTTRAERAAEAARLKDSGLNGIEIAERLGLSKSYTYGLLNDPDGSKDRERKRKYDRECIECGSRVDGTTPGKSSGRCFSCSVDRNRLWDQDAIVLCIQEWADEHGGVPPAANDFLKARAVGGPVPAVNTVQGYFGSWNAAIVAAGFEPHAIGPVGGYTPLTPAQRQECAARYAAGESSTRIAADLDCSAPMVLKWARRAGVDIRPAFARGEQAA